MDVDLNRATKPAKKLRKLLKSFPADPSPGDVHSLRTQTRRLEAYVHELFAEDDNEAGKLLKAVKPVRRAAGKVRDMDVLIGKSCAVRVKPEQECMIKLAEHLAGMRKKHLERLEKTIHRRSSKARKLLKEYLRRMSESDATAGERPDRIRELTAELEHWPKLHAQNLHEFRIHAKELRYMLQLKVHQDRAAIAAFGRIKDTAGDWHDWVELEQIARQVLNPETDDAVLREMHNTMREKLRVALTAANAVRRHSPTRLAA